MFQQKKIFLAVSQVLSAGIAATFSVAALGQTPPPQTPPASDTGVVIFGDKRVVPPPAAPGAARGGPVETEKTVVTGTNIRSIFEEQTLPVIVMTREDIEKSSALNMEQLVQQIAQVSTAGSITGSTLAGQSTYGQSSVSLRGLGAQRTLVLLNGRRIPGFGLLGSTGGGIDLNSIPVAALERIEILTDGASSIYGSDAEAGVINFITRRNYRGAEVSIEYGQPTRSGGGAVERYSAMLGVGSLKDDRFNFWFNWSRRNEEDLRATDREFSKTGNQPPYLESGATPSGRIEGVYLPGLTPDQNKFSASNPLGYLTRGFGNPGRDQPGGCESFDMFPIAAAPQAPSTGKNCNFDSNPFVGLIPTQRNDNIFSTFTFQLTPNTRLFAEGLWARNVVTEAIQPNPMRIAFMETDLAFEGTGVPQALLIFPGNPNYPSAWLQTHGLAAMDGKPLAVTSRTFLTGLRTEQDTNTSKQLTLGIRGTLEKDWEWVFSGVYSKSKTDGMVTNGYFSQLELARVISTVGNTPGSYWNPWATVQNAALDSAIKQQTLYVGPTATGEYTNKGIDFRASGTVKEMQAGPLGLAFGASAHKEDYTVEVPDILGLGDIAGLGGATSPAQGDRRTLSAYAEVNIPIIKTLEVNLSGRVDNYDDLKSDNTPVTGKAAFAWKPIQQLLVRGNVGKGFRAPTMGELHTPVTLGTSEQFVDPANPDLGTQQPNALTGGNTELKPEKSKQWSVGVAFSPTTTISGHVDYWSIQIDDFIVAPTAAPQVAAARAGSYLVRPGEVIFSGSGEVEQVDETVANAAVAKFAGFDFGAHWGDSFGFGRLSADYNGTYFTKADLNWPSAPIEHSIGTLVDSTTGNSLTLPGNGVIVRYKHHLMIGWSNNMFGLNLTQNYYTGYRTGNNQVDGAPHYVDAFTTYDLQGQWTPMKNVKVALGVKNLFDKDPNLVIPTANFFQAGYDPSIYDPRARFFYGRVTVTY